MFFNLSTSNKSNNCKFFSSCHFFNLNYFVNIIWCGGVSMWDGIKLDGHFNCCWLNQNCGNVYWFLNKLCHAFNNAMRCTDIYSNIHVLLVLVFSFANFDLLFMLMALCGVRLDGFLTWLALSIMRSLVWAGLKIGLELRNLVIMSYKLHLKVFERLKEVLFAMFMAQYFSLCLVLAM